ncbi:pyridoxal-phosphate dependent enzyme [Nonomuraea sp. NPDC050451]|uniref:pyridoxal-phosphate dependent enzyme n=1 Tax=Nonomuraea sp. NPDC050451 TaxID=3364364 RepID=UPI00378A8175
MGVPVLRELDGKSPQDFSPDQPAAIVTRVPVNVWNQDRSTPVSAVSVEYRGRSHRMLLKCESYNATGSVKDRTALGLLRDLDAREPLRPGSVVVESTSGNLGVALARLLGELRCHLIAVVDPKTPNSTLQRLGAYGARTHMVREPDGHGGYLLNRLEAVARICHENPRYRWTDQYSNPANPLIHQHTTGPEIIAQAGPELDTIYVAVSTGGTLAGISAHVRPLGRSIRLVAVDAASSLVMSPADGPPTVLSAGSRLVPGIGASRPSSFLRPGSFDRAMAVADATAIAMCRIFLEDTGINLGGSSGSVVSACVDDLAGSTPPRLPLCLAADSGDTYTETLYDDDWLIRTGAFDDVKRSISKFRSDGLGFRLES